MSSLLQLTHATGRCMLIDPNKILAVLPYNDETVGVTLQKKNGESWTIEVRDTVDDIVKALKA